MSWRSLHIHYHDPQDALLVEAIGPLVESYHPGCLSRWFFLRYWKQGPHIRLRFRLNEATDEVTPRAIRARIDQYLIHNPSTAAPPAERLRDVLGMLAKLEGEEGAAAQGILPDNTVRSQPYEPEYEKYGGPPGVAIAERLFERSSDVALDVLGMIRQAPARRLGIGFSMMLAGLRGAGLSEIDITDFLAAYFVFWSRYLSGEVVAAWAASLPEQLRTLMPPAAAVLSDRPPSDSPTSAALVHWRAAVHDAVRALDEMADDILPAVTMVGSNAPPTRRREFVLLNYLHTHNNRLGVLPAQEAYLSYLGHHVVCRLSGVAPREGLWQK